MIKIDLKGCNEQKKSVHLYRNPAAIAQLVEHQLPKLRVASSNLVCRSITYGQKP